MEFFIFLNILKLESEIEVLDLSRGNTFSHIFQPYFFIKESSDEEKENFPKLCDSPITNLRRTLLILFHSYTKSCFTACLLISESALRPLERLEEKKNMYYSGS
jgi:hypothetical protein